MIVVCMSNELSEWNADITSSQVLERWLQQNKIQGFLLHIHEGLQDHLKSVLDCILDRYGGTATATTVFLICYRAGTHGPMPISSDVWIPLAGRT
jgi:hypothetical protein